MTGKKDSSSLARLVQLRQQQLDQRQAELASRQAVRARYQRNVEQLEALWRSSATSASVAPALALNCANYKQTVLQLANVHRADMQRHELAVDGARQAVLLASRRHGALEQMLDQQRLENQRGQSRTEQKRQDEMASLVWQRRSA